MERKTFEIRKQVRPVSEWAKQNHKSYLHLRKQVRQALKEGPATIPELAEKTRIPADEVLFVVMTLRKYNEVETGDLDDMDEYYSYKLKEK